MIRLFLRFVALPAVAILFLVAGPCLARDNSSGNVDAKEAAEMLAAGNNITLLDVRTPREFRSGHIKGAKNLDFLGGAFDMQIRDLPKDGTYLVYCRSGKRSEAATEELKKAGITNVINMKDGLNGWQKAALPLEKQE